MHPNVMTGPRGMRNGSEPRIVRHRHTDAASDKRSAMGCNGTGSIMLHVRSASSANTRALPRVLCRITGGRAVCICASCGVQTAVSRRER